MIRVFISSVGHISDVAARELAAWLPLVLQQVLPVREPMGLPRAGRALAMSEGVSERTDFAIACVSRENQHDPWLNYEIGSLISALEHGRVAPLLVDLRPFEVTGPISGIRLGALNHESDMFTLVRSLNSACQRPVDDGVLRRTFGRYWPDLQEHVNTSLKLEAVESPVGGAERSDSDVLREVLALVRSIDRRVPSADVLGPATNVRALVAALLGQYVGRRDPNLPLPGGSLQRHALLRILSETPGAIPEACSHELAHDLLDIHDRMTFQ